MIEHLILKERKGSFFDGNLFMFLGLNVTLALLGTKATLRVVPLSQTSAAN